MKWEYKVVNIKEYLILKFGYKEYAVEQILDREGIDSWELVTVDNGMAYFKRPDQNYVKEVVEAQMGKRPVVIPEGVYPQRDKR